MENVKRETDSYVDVRSPWPLLRAGKAEQEEGLKLVRQGYEREPDGSHIMRLGIALLWLEQYAPAWEHFQKAIKERSKSDVFYGMAGVAKWCLGEKHEAVLNWVSGLKANYARAGGLGVSIPLLLFFASVVKPDLYDNDAARKLMLEKVKDPRIKFWPGPIVQWILGQIKGGELLRHCQGRHEHDLRENLWQAEFYRSLMRFEQSKISDFRESMRKLTDIQQPEWQNERTFLARVWKEECFLARHEAERPTQAVRLKEGR